jgi:hypothetical protein
LLLYAVVHTAEKQDRDGGVPLMTTLFGLFPFLLKLYADDWQRIGNVSIETVSHFCAGRPSG